MFFEYDVDTKVLELYVLVKVSNVISYDNSNAYCQLTIQYKRYCILICKPKMKNLSHNFLEKYPFSP